MRKSFSFFFNIMEMKKLFIGVGLGIFLMIIITRLLGFKIEWADLMVEAHGVLAEIILFGYIVSKIEEKSKLIQQQISKEEEIKKFHQEIDDFRDWKDKEASYRIKGLIRRLYSLGESNINLFGCYLEEIKFPNGDFFDLNLEEANLVNSDLTSSFFSNCKFIKTNFIGTNARGVDFINCDFSKADFSQADFSNAIFYKPRLNDIVISEESKFEFATIYSDNISDELKAKLRTKHCFFKAEKDFIPKEK